MSAIEPLPGPIQSVVALFLYAALVYVPLGVAWLIAKVFFPGQELEAMAGGITVFFVLLFLLIAHDRGNTIDSKITDREYTIISQYGAVLEKRSEFLGHESDLPFPKEEIRATLLKAQQDPAYTPIRSVVNLCLKALDTYVPDEEYENIQDLISRCFDLVRRGDSESFSFLLAQVSEHQRKAFQAVVDMNSTARSVANELPVLEEKLQAIEAIVDKISKSKR